MWLALKQNYTLAEQHATRGFRFTVLFEPFAGSFNTTKVAASQFGWLNTQPMDIADGYDLLSRQGKALLWNAVQQHKPLLILLAFDCRIWSLLTNLSPEVDWEEARRTLGKKTLDLVVDVCIYQCLHGRYYLIENPAGSLAWLFEGILQKLLELANGKYVIGDQCAYGQRDAVSQKPIRKPTGWLSNSEPILNAVGKRCKCAWGSHQQVLGSNTKGLRSKQASTYPHALCVAICRGLKLQMELDYAADMVFRDGRYAFALEDDEEVVLSDEEDPRLTGKYGDMWQVDGDRLIRHHNVLRTKLFTPTASMKFPPPIQFEDLLHGRVTHMKHFNDPKVYHDTTSWHVLPVPEMPELWYGHTEFRWSKARDEENQEGDVPMDVEVEGQAAEIVPAEAPDVEDLREESQVTKVPQTPGGRAAPNTPGGGPTLRRRRDRTRQLQRGFWLEVGEQEAKDLLQATLDYVNEQGSASWNRLDLNTELGEHWKSYESAQADVKLILASTRANRMQKPQPFSGPSEVPLRRSYLLLQGDKVLSTSWEEWSRMSPSSQIRPLIAKSRQIYVAVFGCPLGEDLVEEQDDRFAAKEAERLRKWQVLPRELKLAIKRIHVNLGHANVSAMLRALRTSRASETAIKAVRLFRCEDCPRMQEHPKEPRPAKLPQVHDFNVQIGLDILVDKDSEGQQWAWLSILCQGTCFHICALLPQTHQNPTGAVLMEALSTHWFSWAGFPERGVIADRAKYFLAEVSEQFDAHGCIFTTAAKASPWQIGQVERHNDLWKKTLKKLVWSQQVAGKDDMLLATAATNMAKNSMSRQHGFSPYQWIIGRDIRLPGALSDEGEVHRMGMMALAETPGSRFFRQNQLRAAARESFAKAANDSALRRAELRKIRPARGPFPIGTYVFYYDKGDRAPGPHNWRGIARVIGREGKSTIWLSHRGILIAVSPEHLSRAYDEELNQWMAVNHEQDLIDATPAAGGAGFLDLRKAALPEGLEPSEHDEVEAEPLEEPTGVPMDEAAEEPVIPETAVPETPVEEENQPMPIAPEDLSSSSLSMARMRLESDRAARRATRSGDFFNMRERQRREQREKRLEEMRQRAEAAANAMPPENVPVGPEWEPELDDYHTRPTRQLSPVVEMENEAAEREAKRLRVNEPAEDSALYAHENVMAYLAVESKDFLKDQAAQQYEKFEEFYAEKGVSRDHFLFASRRNVFEHKYLELAEHAFAAGQTHEPVKKRGRKEIKLSELSREQQELFTGLDGSDGKEWDAWKSKEACEVMDPSRSAQIRRDKPDLIVPTRWVRTNKHDGLVGQPFKAKSRLVVQGFKDKMLGAYRRDAPTASAIIAESICLTMVAYFGFVLLAKDIKNAYFSGKSVGREVYLEQPRGGLPGLLPGQLMRAHKAIYGFAEAARLFWLALREHLLADGWVESRLEPALFFLRDKDRLRGILVTHVDDLEGGVEASYMDSAFRQSALSLEFATNHVKDFIFRGREVKQTSEGHIDVTMKNYALSMKKISISHARKKQLESSLDEGEKELLNSVAGELGWIARQLRCDLACENGCVQRAKADPCVADLVRLKSYVGMARRGSDFRLRYWSDVDVRNGVLLHLADSGHANGTPEHNEQLRYRSIGGYFILLANPEILEGKEARCNVITFHSSLTKRVCRSTLAAEASHLAEAVESGDWIAVLLEEALTGKLDLKNWSEVVERRQRVYVTDARSVFDYLAKDASSTSTDKRMAIEGALLRETVRRPNASVKWIDGMQNIADVLTKLSADKSVLRAFLQDGKLCLVQTDENKALKEKKQQDRQRRNKVKRENTSLKDAMRKSRRSQVVAEVQQMSSSESELGSKEKEPV